MAQAVRLPGLKCLYTCHSGVLRRPLSPLRALGRLNDRSIASYTHSHHATAISVLPTEVDAFSAEYKQNALQLGDVVQKMNDLHAKIEIGGSQKARDKHVARGKMLPREYTIFWFATFLDCIC